MSDNSGGSSIEKEGQSIGTWHCLYGRRKALAIDNSAQTQERYHMEMEASGHLDTVPQT